MEKYCPKCFKKFPASFDECPVDGTNLVSLDDRDLTGQVLDKRYTVLERIGRGGMGVVYKAEQHLIKRIVALKVLRREIVQDESAVQRFLTEAKATAALDSRRTITLYDFGVTSDGLLYYTMELLKGRPLSSIIRDEAPIDPYRAAFLLFQVCESLEEAHEHGILHRDLKPENLYVIEKRGKEQIKVLDFGIAKLVGDIAGDAITRTGMIVGTPQYLSPEQAQGNPVVPASDLYSIGIVLYEMLSGSPPFLYDTPMKTLWAHIRNPVPSLQETNPDVKVPRSVELFLRKALEKEAGKRFQSAAAFRGALKRAIEDHDATPETVFLPPLSTTNEGLRLKTQAWEAPRRPASLEKSSPAPHESKDEGTGTALIGYDPQTSPLSERPPSELQPQSSPDTAEPPEAPVPEPEQVSQPAPLPESVEARPEPDGPEVAVPTSSAVDPEPGFGVAATIFMDQDAEMPVDAEQSVPPGTSEEPENDLDAAARPREQEVLPTDEPEIRASPAVEKESDVEQARPDAYAMFVRSRNRILWGGGVAAALVLAIVVVWWPSPEKKGSSVQTSQQKSPESEKAKPVSRPSSTPRATDPPPSSEESQEGTEKKEGVPESGRLREEAETAGPNKEARDEAAEGKKEKQTEKEVEAKTTLCAPDCEGKECGRDGCKGSCGECGTNEVCSDGGLCECGEGSAKCDGMCCDPGAACHREACCVPDCGDKECGDDQCGGSCGTCPGPQDACVKGRCQPACKDKDCGPDGCKGSCGTCASNEKCDHGRCTPICVPKCRGRDCGRDGCGGSCGHCGSGETCRNGKCVKAWELLVQQGKEAMDRGQYEEAKELFSKAKDKGAPASAMDVLVRKCLDRIREGECRKLVSQGKSAHAEGRWKDCIRHLDFAIKQGCSIDKRVEKIYERCSYGY